MENVIYESVTIDSIEDIDGESLLIKGMANAYLSKDDKEVVVDDWNTTFTPMSFKIDNYINNPVILAQHDTHTPIGRAVKVEKREDGLYIEAIVFKNSDPVTFSNLRNKVITTFSVGVEIKQDYWSDVLDAWVIVDAELVEISVVTLPSNNQSFIEEVSLCNLGVCNVIRGKGKTTSTRASRKHDLMIVTNLLKNILNKK